MDCALSATGPKLSTAIVIGPIPRKPNATRPNANTGAAKVNSGGMRAITAGFLDTMYATNIRIIMVRPSQNAEKLPATRPERMFREAPPCLLLVTTSLT